MSYVLKLREIKRLLEENDDTYDVLKDKFFIGAVTYIEGTDERIERWELNYYDAKKGRILRCVVDDEGYDIYEDESSMPLTSLPESVEIEMDEEEAMNKAYTEYMENHRGREVVGVLVALDMIKGVWLISLITRDLKAIKYEVDMKSGKVREEEVALAHGA